MIDVLDQIYEKLPEAHHYGHYLSAMCLFHSGYRRNLMIYEDTYVCLSCGAFGQTKNLLKRFTSLPIKPVKKLDFRNPWTKWMRSNNLAGVLKSSWQTLCSNLPLGDYLTKRKIPSETQQKLGIGYRDDWYTFPIRDSNNKIIGAVARRGEENPSTAKYIFPSEQEDMLYVPSWKKLKTASRVYLTFGILDALSIHELGLVGISTTRGQKADVELFDEIQQNIIIIPDYGEEQSAYELARKIGLRGNVKTIEYPYGTKDINDLHANNLIEGILI